MGNYSLTFGSFIRSGNYPLEADYIFNSIEDLEQWHSDEMSRNGGEILHDGLLKIVKSSDTNEEDLVTENQILYWCYNKEFYPLCDLSTFTNLEKVKEFIGKADTITDWIKHIDEHLGKKVKDLLKELDLTQLSVGLNPSGYLDPVCMNNTNYLIGARTIIGCLTKLDEAISESVSYSIEYKDNHIYLLKGDEKVGDIDLSDLVKDGMVESVVIEDNNLVITWNGDSEIEPTIIPISDIFNAENYYTKAEFNKALDEYIKKSKLVLYTDENPFENESNFRKALDDRYLTFEQFKELTGWYEAN